MKKLKSISSILSILMIIILGITIAIYIDNVNKKGIIEINLLEKEVYNNQVVNVEIVNNTNENYVFPLNFKNNYKEKDVSCLFPFFVLKSYNEGGFKS